MVDENDNEPQFESNIYYLKVVENEPIGSELLQIRAFDDDSGDTIEYHLDSFDSLNKYFELEKNTGCYFNFPSGNPFICAYHYIMDELIHPFFECSI